MIRCISKKIKGEMPMQIEKQDKFGLKNVETNENRKRLLKPKNDFVFQSLFSKENEYITKEFVEALLEEKIEEMTINETKELFREIDIIEIKKAKREYSKNRENKRVQWIMFLDNPEGEEVKEIMNKNEGVKEAVIKVKEMSEDEKMRKLEELREKAIRDEASCYSTGVHEGEKKRKDNR